MRIPVALCRLAVLDEPPHWHVHLKITYIGICENGEDTQQRGLINLPKMENMPKKKKQRLKNRFFSK